MSPHGDRGMVNATGREQVDSAFVELLLAPFGPVRVRYSPLRPTARQEAFLLLSDLEVFFGGAAAGGKSVALLMAALQYADVPGYHALLLRPNLNEFSLSGGLIDLGHEWLAPTNAQWTSETKTWRFPGPGRTGSGGASLTFGYLADQADLGRYAGSSFSFLGFDELTRFEEQVYRRIFRVLRQPSAEGGEAATDGTTLAQVPVRVRATSNPGGAGHSWVKSRFVDPNTRAPNVVFVPSRLADNPHLDSATYTITLAELPNAERERLLHGDWEIPDDGELFQRDWFPLIELHQLPSSGIRSVRYWDFAATEPNSRNRDPDSTVGLRLDLHEESGIYYISDIVRARKAPGAIEQLVAATAQRDGRYVRIQLEQEPGAAGVQVVHRYTSHVLRGFAVRAIRVTGDKATRAWAVAAAAENGLIRLVRGRNSDAFLDELSSFPHGRHDDFVDALAGAHTALARSGGRVTSHPVHQLRIQQPSRIPTGSNRDHFSGRDDNYLAELAARLGAIIQTAPPPNLVTRRSNRAPIPERDVGEAPSGRRT